MFPSGAPGRCPFPEGWRLAVPFPDNDTDGSAKIDAGIVLLGTAELAEVQLLRHINV